MGVDAAKVVSELARWLPVLWELIRAFGGDKRKAIKQIREWELAERAKRDERMGRRR